LVAKSQAALCHHSYAIIDSGEEKFLPKMHVPLVLLKKTKKVIRVCCPNADELLHSNPMWISSRLLNHERITTSFTATLHRVMDMHYYCMLQNCFGTNGFTSKNICFRGPHAPNAYSKTLYSLAASHCKLDQNLLRMNCVLATFTSNFSRRTSCERNVSRRF
jgi:hypothetical protein